jgi:hypothetical protein
MPQNPWAKAPGAWIFLDELLETVAQETGVSAAEAARLLREHLETGAVRSEVRKYLLPITVSEPPYLLDLDAPLELGDFKPLRPVDWDRVDWATGTLDSNRVRVRREDVRRVLEGAGVMAKRSATAKCGSIEGEQTTLLEAIGKTASAGSIPMPRRRTGPRPLTRDRVMREMRNDLHCGRFTSDELRGIKQESLAKQYKVSRDTARKALIAVLLESVGVSAASNSDK